MTVGVAILCSSCNKSYDDSDGLGTGANQSDSSVQNAESRPSSRRDRPPRSSADPSQQGVLDSYVTRWDELVAGEVGGEELLEMQRGLSLEAVGRLGPSRELEVFLD